ncbi:type VI secretion system protein TssA [Pseudomonas matsuisoli]|uniref:Type VI secretion-associated protein n=1 Tax=Pseudomonas matsuisoli TaxID=1515666 RepID=A0A917PRZ0_9PSED|nr:type VI secretion system protein TssA [Pseudomonas matsuisoli]GGJ89166.1 type VI secretion-associated protein [Pseudomonas matsuisoli]
MTLTSDLLTSILSIAHTPIAEDNFAGSDARYSPEYETIENEVGKATSIHKTDGPDWHRTHELCVNLLSTQSKDLRIACWLTWALYERYSYLGLHAGITLLAALSDEHWDVLHPAKPRTRTAAFAWLLPRLEEVLTHYTAKIEERALFESLTQTLNTLDSFLTEKLGDQAPLLVPLCRRLKDQLDRTQNIQQTKSEEEVSELSTEVTNTAAAVKKLDFDSEKEAHKALRGLQEAARPLSAFWLKQKNDDVRAFRLARTLLWLPIDSLPGCNAEKITALRGIPADKSNSFRDRIGQRAGGDLLLDLETSIARAPFWLDGQFLVWQCLETLDAHAAMREIEIQLALFLARNPGLELLHFHDGIPFADAQTRGWIDAYVAPHVQGRSPAAPAPVPGGAVTSEGAWNASLAAAVEGLRKDGLKTGIRTLKQGHADARNGRERFHWQLAEARLCIAGKKFELAHNRLDALDRSLQGSALAEWEPQLALDVLRLLHGCLESLPQNPDIREARDETYRRLCHLDLEAVLD